MPTLTFSADFSLLGGPLYRLGRHVGLVRGAANTIGLGIALGAALWGVLLLIASGEGQLERLVGLPAIGAHVRLLVVIPLLFVAETLFDPRACTFATTLARSGIVPVHALPALRNEIERSARLTGARWPEALCLLAALLTTAFASRLQLAGSTAAPDVGQLVHGATLTGWWYWAVCLTVFRFLLLRWLWRMALWCRFLWRVARLELNLVTTHPDGAAGLGYLEAAHAQLAPLVLALSALQAAAFAEELSSGSMQFQAIYPALALLIGVQALLVFGPLFIFTPKLWRARLVGLEHYMELASHYVNAFETKWLGASSAEPLLGTADLQSLADLGNGVSRVEAMRWVPISTRLVTSTVIAVLLPMLPLILFKVPLTDLLEKLFTQLIGL